MDQILVTEPEDISPLQIVEGEDYVTLYTCTPYGVNTHRLLVRGHRIPTPEDEETVDPVQAVTGGNGSPGQDFDGAVFGGCPTVTHSGRSTLDQSDKKGKTAA